MLIINTKEDLGLRKNMKSWGLLVGILFIIAACIAAYFLTAPAEADVSILREADGAYVARHV
jgi:hypothetical protein